MTTFSMTQTVLGTVSSMLNRVLSSQFSNDLFVLREKVNKHLVYLVLVFKATKSHF